MIIHNTDFLANCVSPYARTPSGNCVNTLLDFNNCGSIGTSCSGVGTSCSVGICTNVPVVQLTNATSIWTGGVNGSADDDIFNVTLPFPITLYTTTTNRIQITSNGVSYFFYDRQSSVEHIFPATGCLLEYMLKQLGGQYFAE